MRAIRVVSSNDPGTGHRGETELCLRGWHSPYAVTEKAFFIRARVGTTWPPWGEPRGRRTRTEHTTRGDKSSFSGGCYPAPCRCSLCAARTSPDTGLLHTRGRGKVWVHPEGALVAPGLTPIMCPPRWLQSRSTSQAAGLTDENTDLHPARTLEWQACTQHRVQRV